MCVRPVIRPYVEFEFYKNQTTGEPLTKVLYSPNEILCRFAPISSSVFDFELFYNVREEYLSRGFFFDKTLKKHYRVLDLFPVPCGKCVECLKKRSSDFATRAECHLLDLQARNLRISYYFITLTYCDYCVPENSSLSSRDLQLFFKRLRKYLDFTYFACGEYGSQTMRPHYHFILFSQEYYSLEEIKSFIHDCWKFGLAQIEIPNSGASLRYIARYCDKKIEDNLSKEDYKKIGKIPPFIRISNGIGKNYFLDHKNEILELGYIQLSNGQKASIPDYFFRLLDSSFVKEYKRKLISKSVSKLKSDYFSAVLNDMTLAELYSSKAIIQNNKKHLLTRKDI